MDKAWTAIPGLQADTYGRHSLHAPERIWVEKNCYADLWIEILHAKGYEPLAMLPFTVTVDFEDDQWTFFKPSHEELRGLYGVKVHELTVWRPLIDHVQEHLRAGRLVSIEMDAFWLPDTAGTDYRTKRSKTTIAINHVNMAERRIGYFHNAGYFEATGDDFTHLLNLEPSPTPELPLFAELVSFYPQPERNLEGLQQISLSLMRKQIHVVPASNPVTKFAQRFAQDLPMLQDKGLPYYHAWAFAGIRQWGAAAELTAQWLRWMDTTLPPEAEQAARQFEQMSIDAKTLILKGARTVMSKKPFDPVAHLQHSATSWDTGMGLLRTVLQKT